MNQEEEEAVPGQYNKSYGYGNNLPLFSDQESSQFSDFLDSPARYMTDIRTKKWATYRCNTDYHCKVGSEVDPGNKWYSEVNEPILSAWFKRDRAPIRKFHKLRPRGKEVSRYEGQSDTSNSTIQCINETTGSLVLNGPRRFGGTSLEDSDQKDNAGDTEKIPLSSALATNIKSDRYSLNGYEWFRRSIKNGDAISFPPDDIESCITMLEASEESLAPSRWQSRGSEINWQVSKMTEQINNLVSRLDAMEEKLAGQSTAKPIIANSITELGSMISSLKNEMADRDAWLVNLWKKGSKVEQATIARKSLALKLRKYKHGMKKTRKKTHNGKKFLQKKKEIECEDFVITDADTNSLRSEVQSPIRKISLVTNDFKDINKLTEKREQQKADKRSNDQCEISCLGPLLHDQVLCDTILLMSSKLGSSPEINLDQALSKKYAPHSPLLYQCRSQETTSDESSEEIIKILGSTDNIPNQEHALLASDDLSLPKQKGTPNCSGISTDPDESSDEGASTVDTQQSTKRLLTESRSSKSNITLALKHSEPETKISFVSTKSANDSEKTSDSYPVHQYEFTSFDTNPKNPTKFYIHHSPLDARELDDNELISSPCNHSIYDLEKKQKADSLFNVVTFYNSSSCTQGYQKTESSESQGFHRRWTKATDSNLNKRKVNFPQDFSVNTTSTTLNNIKNCSFRMEQSYTDQFQFFSKNHDLSSSVSRDSLLRPSNILRGGYGRSHSESNNNQKQRKLPLREKR